MRRAARGLWHHLLIVAVATASTASAHGPAPVALEVLALDGGAPSVVHTNIGLATANGDGTYAYGCPSRWDENERALAAASPDGSRILVHSAGVAYLSTDGGCTFDALGLEDRYVTAAARLSDGFVLVAEDAPEDLDETRSHLLRVSADGGVEALTFDLPGEVDGLLATAGGFALAGHEPRAFVARSDGSDVEVRLLADTATPPSRVTPAADDGDTFFARVARGAERTLERIGRDGTSSAARVAESSHGPVRVGERWIALFDGSLHALEGEGWVAVGEVPWTCLRELDGHAFACSLEAHLELSDGSPLPEATPVFSMLQIGPPRACGDADATRSCEREWAHFGGEPGWTETAPATSPTGARRTPGCAAAPVSASGFSGAAALPLALLFVLHRRRRRCIGARVR